MPYPTVRSILPDAIGIIAASERSAMIALSATIERRLRTVGNVSGRMIENSAMSSRVRIGSP
jgi:hypothetical protein